MYSSMFESNSCSLAIDKSESSMKDVTLMFYKSSA